MIPVGLRDVAAATGGRLDPGTDQGHTALDDLEVTGPVVVDSRLAAGGSLFVAVAGEHADGHDHARTAVAAGAVAVLAARPVGVPAVIVADPVEALGRLARLVVDRLTGTGVVGLTGSVGKTGTKDVLDAVLSLDGPTISPEGSYNNEVGVPLTVLRADRGTRHLVVEMGARGRGHVAYLCQIAPPVVGVVLNVGMAHLGEFGSPAETAQAKGELVEALPPDGTAVLNVDDAFVRAMAARTRARVLGVGSVPTADVRFSAVVLDGAARPTFRLETPSGAATVRLGMHGEHQVANAAAAAGAALARGLDLASVVTGLEAARSRSRWRMEVVERADGVTFVNDAYNANPDSVRAALKALVAMAGARRSWAVLGEMRELGAASLAEHDAVGRLAVRLDVDRLVVVGEPARPMHLGAAHEGSWGEESVHVPDVDAAVELLRGELRTGDVVLVKASRAVGLERVVDRLLADAPPGR